MTTKNWLCLAALLTALTMPLQAAKPPKIGVLYYNSFTSLQADYAAGNPAPLKADGAKIVPEGREGSGYLQDGLGALRLEAAGNINPKAGTIAMWVKPLNWQGNDKCFHTMFCVGALKDKRRTFQVYKYYNGHFMLLARNPAVKERVEIYETNHFPKWKPGEWHHVAFTWSKADNRTALYVDGDAVMGSYNADVLPQTIDELADGISFNSVSEAPYSDASHRTIMDELYIFDHAVGEGVIAELMRAGQKDEPPALTFPRIAKAPKIDGVFSEEEYADFFCTNTFVETGKAGFHARETQLYTGYDQENLYVTVRSRTKGGDQNIEILAQRNKRDSDVWLDDAVEVIAMSPDLQHRVQIVGNSIGTVYDAFDGNEKTNGNYEIANLVEGIWWVSEMRIPFKEMGMKPPKPGEVWSVHFSRDWKNPFLFVSLSDSTDFHDPKTTPKWTFGDAKGSAAIRLDVEKIQGKVVNLEVAATGVEPAPLTATLYTLTLDGNVHKFKEIKVNPKAAGKLEYDLNNVNVTSFQNKMGFEVKRADGTILQRSEYVMRSYPPMTLNASLLPMQKRFLLTIDISGLTAPLSSTDLECEFTEDGKVVKQWTIQPKGRVITEQVAPTEWSEKKSFSLKVNAVERGTKKSLCSKQHEWKIPEREFWRDSTAGIDQTVPPPWTPVTRNGNAISVWNRTYLIQPNGLPEQIVSAGAELLSRPLELQIAGNSGKSLVFSGLQFIDTERTDEVKFRATAEDEELSAVLDGRVEFDGFSWFEVKIQPKQADAALTQVRLQYAVPESEVNFAQINRAGTAYVDLFTGDKLPASMGFCPQILFGNDIRALEFCTETDRNYFPEHRADAVTIASENGSKVVTVSMVSAPKPLTGELSYAFGLQAAPVKPLPAGWRSWIQHYGGKHKAQSKLFQQWSWSRWYGFLRPIDAKEFRHAHEVWKTTYPDMKVQPYFCQYILSMISDEYKLYGAEWMSMPRVELMEFGPRYPGKSVVACNGARSYADFWMESLKRFLDDFPTVTGCYWDSIDPRTCENELHGHGWRDSTGKLYPTRDIINVRDFYKRAYKILKQKHPDAIITGHSSQRRNLPTFAFCDVVYDGEQFVSRVSGDPDYTNILNDNYCRAFFGTQFGIVPLFMPAYYNNEKLVVAVTQPTESIYLHSLVYGYIVHSHRINNAVTDAILDITLPFGIGEAEYLPPYAPEQQAKYVRYTGQDDVRLGVYRNPEGRLLVAVGNFGPAKVTAPLVFTRKATVTEKRGGKELGTGTAFSVAIEPHNFVLLETGK